MRLVAINPLYAPQSVKWYLMDDDGGPSVLGAILHCLYTLLALAAIVGLFGLVLGFGPVFDWLTLYISAGGPNPYADTWFMLAKFFYALVVIVAIVNIVWVWQTVIARVRYRRELR